MVNQDEAGRDSALAIGTDGLPIISHHDDATGDLRVTQCDDVRCASSTTALVDTSGLVGELSAIVIGNDGLPLISHYNRTSGNLRVTKCTSRTCE